ncbi:hypothetical protein Q7P37_000898 [Cladosporium fusiforme]
MDIPAHIIDAVHAGPASPKIIDIPKHSRQRAYPQYKDFQSSAEDLSSTSVSEPDHDYNTDLTTPVSSDADDMQPDDVEDFREREYPMLKGKTYLDHGGTTLYAKSLVEDFSADLIGNLYGNPHSASQPSALAGHRVDEVRERALRFFNADPDKFDLVFTANATAAIKMVIDCFRDHASASNTPIWYGYHRDAHTSLVGIRESTKLHRCFTSDEEVDIWINSGGLGGPRARQIGLFAYPGQSNMTGRRLPTSWPGRIRKSTAPLDLSDAATAPDFTALSFYKIFGFPNIGALIVRKDSAHMLQNRRYFGGGTVDMIISINDTWHAKKETSIHDRLEDGTLPFHSIFALDHGMNVHERLYGQNPMKFISMHTAQLGRQLYQGLSRMKHSNGQPLVRIYKDENAVYGDPSVQGATVAFNVMSPDGNLIGFEEVEEAADERQIYVRSGSLCNPGGVATYLEWSPAEMRAAYASGHRCSNPTQIMNGKATGVVRVSLGAMSLAQDVTTLLDFLEDVYIDQMPETKAVDAKEFFLSAEQKHDYEPSYPHSLSARSASRASATSSIPHALHIPPSDVMHNGPPTPSAKSTSGASRHGDHWTDASTMPSSASAHEVDTGPPRHGPPFIPSDYTRRPWEDESRRHHTDAAAEAEAKYREMEAALMAKAGQNNSNSVKARRFGRSVVNLLRQKSNHHLDTSYNNSKTPPPIPDQHSFPGLYRQRSTDKSPHISENVTALSVA